MHQTIKPETAAVDSFCGAVPISIDCHSIIAVLIKTVDEQQLQIKNQEYSLKEQKAQLAKLRGEIERIKISLRATAVR